jgi:hypothetical protein
LIQSCYLRISSRSSDLSASAIQWGPEAGFAHAATTDEGAVMREMDRFAVPQYAASMI